MRLARQHVFFIIIVLTNIIGKAYYAGYASYNFDEIISVKDTLLDFGHIKHEAEWDNNPPFYYYCLWVWHKILPISEFNSRLLSVLFVSFAVGFAFWFAQKVFNFKVAIYCSLLLTLSNFLLYYSLETRTYSLVVLLSVLSSLQLFKFLEEANLKNLLLLSLINFLIVYSHYISGIVVMVQYLFIVLYHRKLVKFVFLVESAVILGLILLRFTRKQFLNIFHFNDNGVFWLKTATFNDLLLTTTSLFYNLIVVCAILLSVIAFMYYLFKHPNESHNKFQTYCFLLGIFPLFFLFFIGLFKSVFLDRYLIFCIPFATMLLSFQLSRQKTLGTIVFMVLLVILALTYKFKKESNMDYRGISRLVKILKSEGDGIVINTRDNVILFEYYYDKDKFLKYKSMDSIAHSQNIYGVNNVDALANIKFPDAKRVFLIQSFHKIDKRSNEVLDHLAGLYSKVYSTNYYNGIEFTVFIR